MSKRNLKLLIIILIIIVITIFGFLYFSNTSTTNPTGTTTGTNFFSQFFPSSKPVTQTPEVTPPANVSGFEQAPTVETPTVKLNRVSSIPIAGFGIFMKERFKEVPIVLPVVPVEQTTTPAGNTTVTTKTEKPTAPPTEFVPAIRYVDRAIGNIYQTFADRIDERKFSGTVIPEVNEAYLANSGESVIMRYLKSDGITIESFIGSLPKEFLGADTAGNNEISGSFLPENITDVSISPDS